MSADLFSLDGRVALVTGGNSGLGRAIALGLRDAGATVVASGRDAQKNDRIAGELGGPDAVVSADVRDEDSVAAAVATVVDRHGRLDIVVNNAGNYIFGPVLELSLADWNDVVQTHLTGSFLCAKHAARAMVEGGEGGKIINVGSMYSVYGPPGGVSYASAKTGVLGLTRALAVELAIHGIQVNAVLPGWYDTAMTSGGKMSEWGERIRAKTPAGRWGEPEDLVGAAVFLSGRASDFVTGVALPVDGGYAIADRLLPE